MFTENPLKRKLESQNDLMAPINKKRKLNEPISFNDVGTVEIPDSIFGGGGDSTTDYNLDNNTNSIK